MSSAPPPRAAKGLWSSFVNVIRNRRFATPDEAYDSSNDWEVMRQPGTILPRVMWRVIFWTCYAYIVYYVQVHYGYHISLGSGSKFFYTFTSFFIVFRLNGAYQRYCAALVTVQEITDAIRNIIGSTVAYMDVKSPATKEEDIAQTNEWKVDTIRFALVYGFTVKLQSRMRHAASVGFLSAQDKELVDFDLMRTRGLLHEKEYEVVQELISTGGWSNFTTGCCCPETRYDHTSINRQCGLANWALQQLRHRVARFTVRQHGTVERVLNLITSDIAILQKHSTKIGQSAAIPVPLDYMQMTKFLIFLFQVLFPLEIPAKDGFFTNLFFPSILAVIFYGIDMMCTDMEDPFGDDSSDLKIVTPLLDVEVETLQLLEDKNDPIRSRFVWHPVPDDDEWLRPRMVTKFLSLQSERPAMELLEKQLRGNSPVYHSMRERSPRASDEEALLT